MTPAYSDTVADKQLHKQLSSLTDPQIAGLTAVKIGPSTPAAEMRALESLLSLRLEQAHNACDKDEPVYANLYYAVLEQMASALAEKCRRAQSPAEKAEILSHLADVELSLNAEPSQFTLSESAKLQATHF